MKVGSVCDSCWQTIFQNNDMTSASKRLASSVFGLLFCRPGPLPRFSCCTLLRWLRGSISTSRHTQTAQDWEKRNVTNKLFVYLFICVSLLTYGCDCTRAAQRISWKNKYKIQSTWMGTYFDSKIICSLDNMCEIAWCRFTKSRLIVKTNPGTHSPHWMEMAVWTITLPIPVEKTSAQSAICTWWTGVWRIKTLVKVEISSKRVVAMTFQTAYLVLPFTPNEIFMTFRQYRLLFLITLLCVQLF